MKTRLGSVLALALVLLLTSILPTLAADAKVGDLVAAKWKDGKYYVATVTAVADGRASVLYEDGDKLNIPLSEVYPFSDATRFTVGDRVLAAWKGAQMFPGVVTAVSDVACTVKWADGDKPMEVKKSRMILVP